MYRRLQGQCLILLFVWIDFRLGKGVAPKEAGYTCDSQVRLLISAMQTADRIWSDTGEQYFRSTSYPNSPAMFNTPRTYA